ncbi:MAG: ATP-binding protein [Burkholderiaceae bacterium]|nr:ATP-binding protein [Burkholderiaceae bacterium]
MGRALFNLVENAIKYSLADTRVDIVLCVKTGGNSINAVGCINPSPRIAEIIVMDEGYGISAANLPRIFDPYTRFSSPVTDAEKVTTQTPTGHGLGLRLVKTVVEVHRGSILYKSVPGEGSVFTIKLPCE